MININLIPAEFRKSLPRDNPLHNLKIRHLFFVVVAGVTLQVLFLGLHIWKLSSYRKIEREFKSMDKDVKRFSQVKKRFKNLKSLGDTLRGYAQRRFLASFLFDRLVEHAPPGVWFNRIILKGNSLILRGSAISHSGKSESLQVNELVESLNRNKDFKSLVESAELKSLRRKTVGTREVVDFIINCKLLS